MFDRIVMKTSSNKTAQSNKFMNKIKIAVEELNAVKTGKIKAKSFDELLKEIK
jgi:DNA-binding Xre family transcriptional regulator